MLSQTRTKKWRDTGRFHGAGKIDQFEYINFGQMTRSGRQSITCQNHSKADDWIRIIVALSQTTTESYRMTETKQQKRSEASTSNSNEEDISPELKKARLFQQKNASPTLPSPLPQAAAGVKNPPIRWLIENVEDNQFSKIPISLCETKIGQDLDKLRELLDSHGLRTSKISSPREAVSIYTQSCRLTSTESDDDSLVRDGKEFLLISFGLHPEQEAIEREYERFTKNAYCILLFCRKLRQEYSFGKEETVSEDLQRLFSGIDETCLSLTEIRKNGCGVTSQFTEERVNSLIDLATKVKGRRCYRKEEWRKEYQRICVSNSTISNACVVLLQAFHEMCIKDVYLKLNKQEPKYERITIYLYDPAIDYGRRPNYFSFLPGLRTIVTKGPETLVSEMIEAFWIFVIRKGYFPPSKLRNVLDSKLYSFLLAGITPSSPATGSSKNLPLPLKANFVPTVPFSIYLHGKAGAGMLSALDIHSAASSFEAILFSHILIFSSLYFQARARWQKYYQQRYRARWKNSLIRSV